MRRTINISMPEDLYEYIDKQRGFSTVSEYIRRLVARDRERRADYRARPRPPEVLGGSASHTFVEALEQLDKLRVILERSDR